MRPEDSVTGDTLDPVNATFVLELPEGALALDSENDLLEAADANVVGVQDFGMKAEGLGVAYVHAIEVGGEECGLVSSRARPDLHDHVLTVPQVSRDQGLNDLP